MPPIVILIIGIIILIIGILCFTSDIIFKQDDSNKYVGILFLFIGIFPTIFGVNQLSITFLEKKYNKGSTKRAVD